MSSLVKIHGMYFLDGIWLTNESRGFFYCHEKSCPFAVRLLSNDNGSVEQSLAYEVLFPVHCHAFPGSSRREIKALLQKELDIIEEGGPGSDVLKKKHQQWKVEAQKKCEKLVNDLVYKDGVDDYAVKHPEATGSQLRKHTGKKMTRRAASMAQLRALRKAGKVTTITELVQAKAHHLLANDGHDILVFGDKATIPYMSTTPLILADGTFSAVLPGYKQLYILHVVVANNVAVPAFFCLVKGKDKATYKKILELVEGVAEADETTYFGRPVTVMCDFEDAFIKVVEKHYKLVTVKCCLFHFAQNIRKKARPVITKVEKAAGKNSEEARFAETTKRRFTMLALLPEVLITPEVVRLILDDWKASAPKGLEDAFDDLFKTVMRTYVGAPRRDGQPPRTLFPPHLWSVSGRSIGTNNGAESCHSALNPKTKGAISVRRFLRLLEEVMDDARDRIATGCQPESRPEISAKNQALAVLLDNLFRGQQEVLQFLDNCGLVLSLDDVESVQQFAARELLQRQDSELSRTNGDLLDQAARNLYFRLHPTGQLTDDEILGNVTNWAFRVLLPAQVPRSNSGRPELSLVDTEPRESFVASLEEAKKKYLPGQAPEGDEWDHETEESRTESDDATEEE